MASGFVGKMVALARRINFAQYFVDVVGKRDRDTGRTTHLRGSDLHSQHTTAARVYTEQEDTGSTTSSHLVYPATCLSAIAINSKILAFIPSRPLSLPYRMLA